MITENEISVGMRFTSINTKAHSRTGLEYRFISAMDEKYVTIADKFRCGMRPITSLPKVDFIGYINRDDIEILKGSEKV